MSTTPIREDQHAITLRGVEGYWDAMDGDPFAGGTVTLTRRNTAETLTALLPLMNAAFSSVPLEGDRSFTLPAELKVQLLAPDATPIREGLFVCEVYQIKALRFDSNSNNVALQHVTMRVNSVATSTPALEAVA